MKNLYLMQADLVEKIEKLSPGTEEHEKAVNALNAVQEMINEQKRLDRETKEKNKRFILDCVKVGSALAFGIVTVAVTIELEQNGHVSSEIHKKILKMIPIKV